MLRSILFMPGNNEKILSRVEKLNADAVILDLEDGVPPAEKEKARELVYRRLQSLKVADLKKRIYVRVNGPGMGCMREDLRAVLSPVLDGLMLPMVNSTQEIHKLTTLLTVLSTGKKDIKLNELSLLLNVETARGILNLSELMSATDLVSGAALGGEDLSLDMRAKRTSGGNEIAYARSHLVMASRAADKLAIDTVFTDIEDTEGLRKEAREAARMGYDGKLLIHPSQIEPVNEIFMPAPEEINFARRVVEAFERGEEEGRGAVKVDGKMVDPPVAARARRILEMADDRIF